MIRVYSELEQIVTLKGVHQKDGRRLLPDDLGIIPNASIVFDDDKILWVGPAGNLPGQYLNIPDTKLRGHVLTPEIVDSHTHIVFGGDRAQEYADRLNGKTYEEIAKEGGGILSTMKMTNEESLEELYLTAKERIERIASYGVGTIEIKSGYGLNYDREYKVSILIDRLKKEFAPKIQIFNTYLAAHDVPKFFSDSAAYLDEVVLPLLDRLAEEKIIDAVDIFHEKGFFNGEDARRLFEKAQTLGIACKSHADELNDNGGAELAAAHGALSADHLLRVSSRGVEALVNSKTVASLLPGTAFFIGKPLAPARALLDAGAKVALASDFNPGSCHCDNLLLIASLCAPQLKLNQAELWAGITYNAAHALGLFKQGALVGGMKPRFTLFKTESLSHVTYNWGRNLAVKKP
jgi:imidazolonepropionase